MFLAKLIMAFATFDKKHNFVINDFVKSLDFIIYYFLTMYAFTFSVFFIFSQFLCFAIIDAISFLLTCLNYEVAVSDYVLNCKFTFLEISRNKYFSFLQKC